MYLLLREPVGWAAAGAGAATPGAEFRDGCRKFPYGRVIRYAGSHPGANRAHGASTLTRHRIRPMNEHRKPRWALYALLAAATIGAGYELRTAAIEARLFSKIASALDYAVEPGKSDRIVLPEAGAMDRRRG